MKTPLDSKIEMLSQENHYQTFQPKLGPSSVVDPVQGNVIYIYMQRGRGTVGKQNGRENRWLHRCLQLTVCKFGVGNEPCYKEGAMDGGMQDTRCKYL